MGRGFGFTSSRVLVAALCSFLFVAAQAGAEERTARLLTIDNESWTSDCIASDAILETTIDTAASIGSPSTRVTIPSGGSVIVRRCSELGGVGITKIRVTAGDATLATQATFRDAAGDFNTVTIPELTTILDAHIPNDSAALSFSRVESTPHRSTFIAFFADTAQYVSIYVYDGRTGRELDVEVASLARGFTWYELTTPVEIGRIAVHRGTTGFGCFDCQSGGDLDAVAFVGYRSGGGPRVEMPELIIHAAR